MPRKQWRFWFAFNKDSTIVLHWRRKKYKVDKLICHSSIETHIRKKYPHESMKGYASDVEFFNQNITITAIIKE